MAYLLLAVTQRSAVACQCCGVAAGIILSKCTEHAPQSFHGMQGDLRYSNWTKPPSSYQPRWDSWGRFVEPLASKVCPFPDFPSQNGVFPSVYRCMVSQNEFRAGAVGAFGASQAPCSAAPGNPEPQSLRHLMMRGRRPDQKHLLGWHLAVVRSGLCTHASALTQ